MAQARQHRQDIPLFFAFANLFGFAQLVNHGYMSHLATSNMYIDNQIVVYNYGVMVAYGPTWIQNQALFINYGASALACLPLILALRLRRHHCEPSESAERRQRAVAFHDDGVCAMVDVWKV